MCQMGEDHRAHCEICLFKPCLLQLLLIQCSLLLLGRHPLGTKEHQRLTYQRP